MVENLTVAFGMLSLSETNCKGKAERCQNRLKPRLFCLRERLNQSGTCWIAVTMWLKQSVSHLGCEISHKSHILSPSDKMRCVSGAVRIWLSNPMSWKIYLFLLSTLEVVNSELLVSPTALVAVVSCPSEVRCWTPGWRVSWWRSLWCLWVFFLSGFVRFNLIFE